MRTFNLGDSVKILPPFSDFFPAVYLVIAIAAAADTYTIDVLNDGSGSDFYIDFLETV